MVTTYTLPAGSITATDGPVLAWDDFCAYGTDAVLDVSNKHCWGGGALSAESVIGNAADVPGIALLAGSSFPTVTDTWLVFSGAASGADALTLRRDGASGVPFFPSGDGAYAELLLIAWMSVTALPSATTGIFGIGRTGTGYRGPGLQLITGGALQETMCNVTVGFSPVLGTPFQIGLHYTFDAAAGTSSVQTYKNGLAVSTLLGPNPTTLVQDSSSSFKIGYFQGNGYGLNGKIGAFIIDEPTVGGRTASAAVAADFEARRAAYGV